MNLTNLNGDDTDDVIARLIDKAVLAYPELFVFILPELLQLNVIYFRDIIHYCYLLLLETKLVVEDGADESDIVISRDAALQQDWTRICKEVSTLKCVCGSKCMKTILAIGELRNELNIYRASWAVMLAGSDFIKTSTGNETVNATVQAVYIICHAIKQFYCRTGKMVGFKASGGIRTTHEAVKYLSIVEEILGTNWLKPSLFRIGASTLLDNVVRTLNCSY
ncbi:unnamed protein product [Thelazia callipaeda]|uniref:deoxyribose-phosphate aldolase n=1 Tax=Thelazia callipaeda TaxID=103827 RepID=A0A158RBS2_THECL|nr:unnamed protein product [Thelazia callipaeda]